jgi:hypothetical protein
VPLDVNVPPEPTALAEQLLPISSPPSRTSTPPSKQIEPVTPASNSIKQEIQLAMPGAFGNDSPAVPTLTRSELPEITLDALQLLEVSTFYHRLTSSSPLSYIKYTGTSFNR